MVLRVDVRPELLRWASARSGSTLEAFHQDDLPVLDWSTGKVQPTLRQLRDFAHKAHVPMGALFLSHPPTEEVPIPDFRRKGHQEPSADLRDTIRLAADRQAWYRDYLLSVDADPLPFVGSAATQAPPEDVAAGIREQLQLDKEDDHPVATWEERRRRLVRLTEEAGILVNVNSMVGHNSHRPLDAKEFQGFALVDQYAPLIFVNSRDTLAAQIFTIAHEWAHVWLGRGGIDDAEANVEADAGQERWCNRVATETLVPAASFRRALDPDTEAETQISDLARRFKVSSLLVIIRLNETRALGNAETQALYEQELARIKALATKDKSGGHGQANITQRVGRRFGQALVYQALEGKTTFREAYRLLGLKDHSSFQGFAKYLGATA